MLTIRVLGDLEVERAGAPSVLPASKKTRALLGYLAAAGRPQRRERLCELFWEGPDDPRGALRWSLSKLRGLSEDEVELIAADRLSAALSPRAAAVDLAQVRAAIGTGLDEADTSVLEAAAARFRGPLLADLDLPHCPLYQAWLVSLREEAAELQRQILRELGDRLAQDPEAALPHLRALVHAAPHDETGWARLVAALVRLGRRHDAEEQHAAGRAILRQEARETSLLDKALKVSPAVVAPASAPEPAPEPELRQDIRFCRAEGNLRIAYAVVGEGPALIKTANWMNHLEYDWESPVWGHFFRGLARRYRLWRYDARGNGLSDWEVGELGLDPWVADLEAVVAASGLERFALLGVSQGCAISVAYAVRHPERVTKLVLYAGFANGAYKREGQTEEHEKRRAMTTLMRLGWGQPNPAFRQMFTSMFVPGASAEQADAFNELQRRTASPECAARYYEASGWLDVRPLLPLVRAPTLVLHPRGDANVAVELGRQMAAGIPGARFVALPGQNHLFLENEPACPMFFDELDRFLKE